MANFLFFFKIIRFIPIGIIVFLCGCGGSTSSGDGKEKVVSTAAGRTVLDSGMSKVVAIGRVEPEVKITSLSSEVQGLVQRLSVKAGDNLEKNAVLLELNHSVEDARLVLTQAKLNTQLRELEVTKSSISGAELVKKNLKERLDRTLKMLEKGAETKQNVDNLQTEFERAGREVERLQNSLVSGQAKMKEWEADLNVTAVEISKKTLRAPSKGLVLNVDITEGAMLTVGKVFAEFAPEAPLTALCEVDELFAQKILLGQRALVRSQGLSDTLGFGEVIQVAPYLKKKSIFSDDTGSLEDRRVREVRVRITKGEALLFNSRVECVIFLK